MRWIVPVLILLLIGLQVRLWFGEGSFAHKAELEQRLAQQKQDNLQQQQRNDKVLREIIALKKDNEAIEERARSDLGMIRDGEVFYLVLESEKKQEQGSK